MTISKVDYYECDNAGCNLRFPVLEEGSKPKRCPRCRSTLHIAQTTNILNEQNRVIINERGWKLEAFLDNIRSAWNVGAILRTSDGLGIKKVYCCGITPTLDQLKVSKTALGAENSVPWEGFTNGVKQAARLKNEGYELWALEDIPEATSLYSIEHVPDKPSVVLILGNENCGVDPAILSKCDKVISIPMSGNKQSFNVAVAYGIAVSFLVYRHNLSHESLRILPNT